MSDEDVGRLDSRALQHGVQFHGDVAGGPRGAARAAPAESAAIVGCGPGEAGDRLLNVKPVQIGGSDSGFKEHGRAARSFFEQVEPEPGPNRYPAPKAGKAPPVAMSADQLIEKPRGDQGCGKTKNPESQIHNRS